MSWVHLLGALAGGLGLFLFSLRSLTRVLQRNLSRRMRGAFTRALGHPLQCLLAGGLATAVVQASSISVMGSMSMVGSTLVTLEQGYFLMLGATLGTTLKAWVISLDVLSLGPLLVGFCSLGLLFVRRTLWREILEGLMAIGLALWGMWLVGRGLEPFLQLPALQDFLRSNPGEDLVQQAAGVLMGVFLAGCVQSSSTVVSLTILLASQGHLTYPQAASIILGANVGTTFGPLLASIEHGPNMRRLALAHTLCKTGGVLITLFFFPAFVSFWAWLVPDSLGPGQVLAFRLAAVHTGFNLINVVWWSILNAPFLRMIEWLVPSNNELPGLALAPVVRRILSRSPARSRDEAIRQLNSLLVTVKSLLDAGTSLIQGEQIQETKLDHRILEQRSFQSLKDSTYELLVQAARGPAEDIRTMMARLADLEELYFQALRLREQLEIGLVRESLELPKELAVLCQSYQRCVDELWLKILFPDGPVPTMDPTLLARQFEDAFFLSLRQGSLSSLQASWSFDMVSNLRSVLLHLGSLAQIRHCDEEGSTADSGEGSSHHVE